MGSTEWSHTHFDGYELLAAPSDFPPSIVVLDSSALVLVQKILLAAGDSPPRSLTWQPGGARTASSSGALSCIVSSGSSLELAIFTPIGVHLSCRVRYSWSCASRVPLSPLHKAPGGRLLLAWSCRGPLVVADQAISVWSNSSTITDATATFFSDDESTEDEEGHPSSAGVGKPEDFPAPVAEGARATTAYRDSLCLSRKWVHKSTGKTRLAEAPQFVALATSPCGCMFAAACKARDEVVVWLRQGNMPPRGGKPWEMEVGVSGQGKRKVPSSAARGQAADEGAWNFQPATVMSHSSPLVQLVWGRGPGSQQDYLMTLGEDGSARVWIEHQDHAGTSIAQGTIKFVHAATIQSWHGDGLRLKSVGFVRWAYFGSHSRELVRHDGTASGSAYHLLHQQEQEANDGGRNYRSDNWVVGCEEDGRRFLWSLKDMPLPDGRTTPELVQVASLPFSWLVGLPATRKTEPAAASNALPQVSAIGYYDAQAADGAPTELQIAARAAGGTIAIITARVHRSDPNGRFLLRNTRSVVLPLGQGAAGGGPGHGQVGVLAHPNLPLVARLGARRNRDAAGERRGRGWAVEVYSWVNGGSHLQCIPCKPRGKENGQPGHTAGAEPGDAGEYTRNDGRALAVSPGSSSTNVSVATAASTAGGGNSNDLVAPIFSELAHKVRSGDELSFVPYALPSLTLGCRSCRGEGAVGGNGAGEGRGVCSCGAETPPSASTGAEDISHAMWLADWIGAEALPPALAVVDSKSRLHVFELDDGASSEGSPDPVTGAFLAGSAEAESSHEDPQRLRAEWQQGRWDSSWKRGGSAVSLSNSNRSLHLKGMVEDSQESDRSSREQMGRRARGEKLGGAPPGEEDTIPTEKTVVLPLDNKYGLGLTLAFENLRVEVATFVKHPDTNEMLPAEASGRIRPGDELVDINGHSVEGLNAEEAMSLIRHARRETMESGSVSLELTFREFVPPPGSVRSRPHPRSPTPRTGWYSSRSRRKFVAGGRGGARGSVKGSTAFGWASTDAEQHALRWQSLGSDEVPEFKLCTLMPWLGGDAGIVAADHEDGMVSGITPGMRGLSLDPHGEGSSSDGRWAEIGVYPPGDPRRRREALLLGFQPVQTSREDDGGKGYVIALLLEVGLAGGVSVTELCRITLEAGHEPLSFNREKVPPGAPTNGRASVEAACADGWVRRWCVASKSPSSASNGDGKDQTRFTLRMVDICRPFGGSGDHQNAPRKSTTTTKAALVAVASPTLVAVARSADKPKPSRAPARAFPDVLTPSETVAAVEDAAAKGEDVPSLEVWSCSPTAYPRCPFKKETVAIPWLRTGQAVEGMCWVSPEAGDERGAAVSGHCLCVSVEGSVTVLARERRQQSSHATLPPDVTPAHESALGGGAGDDVDDCWTWSPVFRVANPCSLLTCRTAGLRDFCQGLMAKYQRNLALSLVRTRRSKTLPRVDTNPLSTLDELPAALPSDAAAAAHTSAGSNALPPPPPPPLLRTEIDGLRGGTTREGRRLEDWHPENLVAMWCTSLGVGSEGNNDGGVGGAGDWAKGRERTLSVLSWVSRDSELESGGVMAGTVVPFLAHSRGVSESSAQGDGRGPEASHGNLSNLRACLSSYLRDRLEEEKQPEPEVPQESVHSVSSPAPSVRRLPHASTRHFLKTSPTGKATPASARDVSDIAAAAGIPRRLLNLSGAELSALSALLDEALGQDVCPPAQSAGSRSMGGAKAAAEAAGRDTAVALFSGRDTAAALFSTPATGAPQPAPPPPPPPSPPMVETKNWESCARIFLLARGLRARSRTSNGRQVGVVLETGIASSAALAMLLSSSTSQKEVLETLCPRALGTELGVGRIAWNDARAMMLPLWIRNVSELHRVMESVADTTFRQDKDLMAAAIFLAVLGKEKKLLSLAKADRGFVGQRHLSGDEGDTNTRSGQAQGPTQGQRLEKLLSHDFSSQRGRAVAEKNAFILLRKRQFKAATAVFLLARPAMVKEAVQVILMHVKDVQLALTVVRLVEVRDAKGASPALPGFRAMGSIGGFGGGGFGGGGIGSFSGGGGRDGSDIEADASAATSTIGRATRRLLRDELLPIFDGEGDIPKGRQRSFASIGATDNPPRQRDPFMECATLFWLGQTERALRALCRGPATENDTSNSASNFDGHASSAVAGTGMSTSTVATDGSLGLAICNRAIDVATRPFLVSKLAGIIRNRQPDRARNSGLTGGYLSGPDRSWQSNTYSGGSGDAVDAKAKAKTRADNAKWEAAMRLTTVEYLARNGMEISALEILGSAAGKKWVAELAKRDEEVKHEGATAKSNSASAERAGSQRDSVRAFANIGPKGRKVLTKEVSFDQTNTGELTGDMFGGFDGPPQAKPKVATSSASAMTSGELSGDMFSGYDGPSPRRASVAMASSAGSSMASGELSGDIFGGFDGPPQRRASMASASRSAGSTMASGELSGDMFGGFDAPPQRREVKKPAASTAATALVSGELSGDLFGGFDPPSTKVPQRSKLGERKSGGPDETVASGELSGALFAAFDGPVPSSARLGSSQKISSSPAPSSIWTPGNSRHDPGSPGDSGGRLSLAETATYSYGYRDKQEPSWDAYDAFVAERHDLAGGVGDGKGQPSTESVPSKFSSSSCSDGPHWWALWAEDLAYQAATKRLLREVRHLFGGLDALAPTASNMAFALESLGSSIAVLGSSKPVGRNGDGNGDGQPAVVLLDGLRATAAALCEAHDLSPRALTAAAAGALCHASAGGSRRLGALCLLLHALGRSVAADAAVCAAAGRLLQCCSVHGQAHLEDLGVRAAHARALGTEAEAAKKEAAAKALSEDGGIEDNDPERARSEDLLNTAAVAKATAERKAAEARAAEEATSAAAGGMGLENLRPHLSELRGAAFQLELCLALHARGCLRLSSRARAEAAVGFRAGLLVEAIGRRYDVTEALVEHPPAPMELDARTLADRHFLQGESRGEERRAWLDTPNADLLDALSRLPNPEFETLGLEPWESTLRGRPRPKKRRQSSLPTVSNPTEETHQGSRPVESAGEEAGNGWTSATDPPPAPDEERLHLARLTESLSRGVWPTYARLACALNLLSLRAMHGQLCGSLARLIWRPSYRARAPLAARVCGSVPFHPAGEGGEALDTEVAEPQDPPRFQRVPTAAGEGKRGRRTASPLTLSSTFYSALLHPLYVWGQCLDRQFYSQAHRPRVPPNYHLVPRRRSRALSPNGLVARAVDGDGKRTGAGHAVSAPIRMSRAWSDGSKAPSPRKYESRLVSPGAERRECCPYLFQRGMTVSEDGVRGGLDHLRSEETWPEEDSEERIAYQMLHGMMRADGSALPSVTLHAVREGARGDAHFVEAFYSSDARSWLLIAGVDPAGPSAGTRLRRWESLGIAQRVTKGTGTGGQIHFIGERHKGDALLRFVDRWEVEHCGESGGGALRGGPLGRMSYQPVQVGKSAASLETLYGKLLHAIGESAALELWKRLAVEDWLVRTVSRAEFPFSYRHQLAGFSSARSGEVAVARALPGTATLTSPAAAAAAAADMPCPLHDGVRRKRDAFFLCVFEHLCRNALFRRLRLPHRFQALVTVQLLGLKNLSPNYHPSKTEVFASVTLKRGDPSAPPSTVASSNGNGGNHHHHHHLHLLGDSVLRRRGRNTSVTAVKALLPTANGQATQQSRWGAKAAFRFPLPEEASPYVLAYGDRAYELVMGGSGGGMGSQGPPRCVRIVVWKKQFLSDQRLGEVEVPLGKLNDRVDVDEWVALRGEKGSYWFVNVRFSLRFVMVSASDPIPGDDVDEDEVDAPDSPGMTLSHALEDVDVM